VLHKSPVGRRRKVQAVIE